MNQPQNPFDAPNVAAFGGGVNDSVITPVVLALLAVTVAAILLLPRRHVLGPLVAVLILVPLGNQIYVAGVHWLAPRILVLAGLARILIRRESKKPLFSGWNPLDRAFLGAYVCQVVAVIMLNRFAMSAVTNQFGFVIDFLISYIVIRALIDDDKDVYRALSWLAFATVILAVGMAHEQMTIRNDFGTFLGGTRTMPDIREGKIRSHGAFQHALTAGTFGATLIPLWFILWRYGRARITSVVGFAAATVVTICSNSSTPLLGYVAGIFAIAMWPLRGNMRLIRRGVALTLVALHLVMKAPVWFLIARVDLTGGSSGYHRAELVDQFIHHFWEWWLIGTNQAATWGYDLWDAQNQFVNVGETGGLLAFVLYVVLIVRAFRVIGERRRALEKRDGEMLCWLLGATLFSNIVAFFGINYYDQIKYSWFLLLIAIAVLTRSPATEGATVTDSADDPVTWRRWRPLLEPAATRAVSPPIGARRFRAGA